MKLVAYQTYILRMAWLVISFYISGVLSQSFSVAQTQRLKISPPHIIIITPKEKLVRDFDNVILQEDEKSKEVTVSLKRYDQTKQSNEFWDGKSWKLGSSLESKQLARLEKGKWFFNTQGAFSHSERYRYTLEVTGAGNDEQISYATRVFLIDSSPGITVDFPGSGIAVSSINQPDWIKGTISTVVTRQPKFVHVFLSHRNSEGIIEHWDGSSWQKDQDTPVAIPATLQRGDFSNNTARWQWDQLVPSALQLQDGDYQIEAFASDDVGDTARSVIRFTISTKPTLQINSPTNERAFTSSPSINGNLSIPLKSDDKISVKIELSQFRLLPLKYWDGQKWTEKQTSIFVKLDPSNQLPGLKSWRLENLPPFQKMPDGRYRVVALAYRKSEVVSATDVFFDVNRGPRVTISPLSDQYSSHMIVNEPLNINGFIEKGIDGKNIEKVSLTLSRLKRDGTGEVWVGNKWVRPPAKSPISLPFRVTKVGRIPWAWKQKIPAMTPGIYYLTVYAVDVKRRVGSTTTSFEILP